VRFRFSRAILDANWMALARLRPQGIASLDQEAVCFARGISRGDVTLRSTGKLAFSHAFSWGFQAEGFYQATEGVRDLIDCLTPPRRR
jgi:hypothetical protein